MVFFGNCMDPTISTIVNVLQLKLQSGITLAILTNQALFSYETCSVGWYRCGGYKYEKSCIYNIMNASVKEVSVSSVGDTGPDSSTLSLPFPFPTGQGQ